MDNSQSDNRNYEKNIMENSAIASVLFDLGKRKPQAFRCLQGLVKQSSMTDVCIFDSTYSIANKEQPIAINGGYTERQRTRRLQAYIPNDIHIKLPN